MSVSLLSLALAAILASGPTRTPNLPRPIRNADQWIHGGNPQQAKAVGDTIVLMGPWGSGAPFSGQFENPQGAPAWNGWTSIDFTQPELHWHADTYNVISGSWSAWCGENFPSCGGGDPDGGYGNNYDEAIEWRAHVADSEQPCAVTIDAVLNHDVEPGYDYVWLSVVKVGFDAPVDLWSVDGTGVQVTVHQETVYEPGEYVGPNADEVVVRFRVTSDVWGSDENCFYPSVGACQLDDVTVSLDNGGVTTFDDFEDGTLGNWEPWVRAGVGDFAQIWTDLRDLDPCIQNPSPQMAFIDDGLVVPGTGGSSCISWCYGPAGSIVNTRGGLAGPDAYLNSAVLSPPIPWPGPEYNGCVIDWDVYRHETFRPGSPGIGDLWMVRATSSPDPAMLAYADWQDRDSGISYGLGYTRRGGEMSDLVADYSNYPSQPPSPPRWVQLRLGAWEWGWWFGLTGDDGTPAPYFDNVRIIAYRRYGPQFSVRELELANDAFIERDGYDSLNPGANHVRFDMAQNVSPASHLRNDPGDSIAFYCEPGRAGAALTGNPRLYYRLWRNPIFDPYRTSGLPDQGFVECDSVRNSQGDWVMDKFCADLPDTGFLFPGDRLRYFIWAEDSDGVENQAAFLPADTSGFSDWSSNLQYSSSFTVRALPTITSLAGDQPGVLFWNDFANRGGQQEWYGAFANLGLIEGRDFDEYYTNAPSSGVGNGLGGRATVADIAGYNDLLYTCGDLSMSTISNGDYEFDPSDDAGLLTAWFQRGGKDALFMGDDLVNDLNQSGATTQAFLGTYLGVSLVSEDVRPLIGTQMSPRTLPETGNPVFSSVSSWIASGGCPRLNQFDAVTPIDSAVRIAEFADATGSPGSYPYSAATLNTVAADNARVISIPYDFMFIATDPDESAVSNGFAARTRFLLDVMQYFGIPGGGDPSAVPEFPAFTAGHAPNPFNPAVTIRYTLLRADRTTLKIYDVRGALVRTLLDDVLTAGPGTATWRGEDDRGARVASGLYFYELRQGGDVRVGKMTLVK